MQPKTNILIIGGGAREHALGLKLKESPRAGEIHFIPGNPGTATIGKNFPLNVMDFGGLIGYAIKNNIGLTIVGPEDPLIGGIVDAFHAADLRIFGPTKAAAQIEGSKAFAKRVMAGMVPTARHQTFTVFEAALAYAEANLPCYIKADGPALGKGAFPCNTAADASRILRRMMIEKEFGDAGTTVVIEDLLRGLELSAHALCDSSHSCLFPFVRDHKKACDGNQGDNTGGMGTVGPVPLSSVYASHIKHGIVDMTLENMEQMGAGYRGLLFPGLMLTSAEDTLPQVLEFNCRFGDPETEVYMRLLDSDLLDLIEACLDDRLDEVEVKWKQGYAACIMLASGGYPGTYKKWIPITGIDDANAMEDVIVFHAGTAMRDDRLVTSGGRVLGVSAFGSTLQTALNRAYAAVGKIHFEGMHYRTDIGASLLPK